MNLRQLAWIMLALILMAGCGSSEKNEFSILFSEPVTLFNTTVVHNGTPIGTVESLENSAINRTQGTLIIDPQFLSLMTQNAVVVLKAGQLNLTTVAPFGDPLESSAVIPGFSSTGKLKLFCLKNMFSDKVMAVRDRAEKLAY